MIIFNIKIQVPEQTLPEFMRAMKRSEPEAFPGEPDAAYMDRIGGAYVMGVLQEGQNALNQDAIPRRLPDLGIIVAQSKPVPVDPPADEGAPE